MKEEKKGEMISILKKIYLSLEKLEYSEHDLFDRDVNMMGSILDIMESRDTDPIKKYHKEAIDVCQKMIDFFESGEPLNTNSQGDFMRLLDFLQLICLIDLDNF